MQRVSLKITGASGQGINSVGEIVAKALKRTGYCVFGYREYPSLIKGGHASYQIDVDARAVRSTEERVNILVALNHHGLEHNVSDLKDGGVILHQTLNWKFQPEEAQALAKRDVHVEYLPIEDILKKLAAKPILGNVLLASCVWALLGQDIKLMKEMVGEKFAHKKDLLELNMRCIEEGYAVGESLAKTRAVALPKPQKEWQDQMLITGSQAMGLGAVHAGVRLYAGYPMTPSSPLLSYIAELQNQTGMVIKQAEDEITAAQMVSGAMFAGTRALTATSGGGFDLMSETVSMNAIIENPTVFVLAQRPGPATGLPTWTGQGDLLMAVGTAHGEFARCVIAVSSADDAFELMPVAFNLAEEYQISVIVLTDKQIAEALYTQKQFDQKKAKLSRGKLVTTATALKKLKCTDRYDPHAENGISPRWLPGAQAETYCAQGDEHNADGTVDESATNAIMQMDKRMKKAAALKAALPEPELFGSQQPELLLVGWGSTKDTVLDALAQDSLSDASIGYLHYSYVWPLRTEKFEVLRKAAKRTVLIEGNVQGQLGMLLRQECGATVHDKILKYDGRPFFLHELTSAIAGQYKQR